MNRNCGGAKMSILQAWRRRNGRFAGAAQLDGDDNCFTLRDPMILHCKTLVLGLCLSLLLALPSPAAVIFKPGEKAKYVAPGEEEISGNAEELFHIGQEAEKRGNLNRAIKAYRTLVRKHPKDALAPVAGTNARLFRRGGSLPLDHAGVSDRQPFPRSDGSAIPDR
jgi:hypothetical protein